MSQDRNELFLAGTVCKPPIYSIGKSGKPYAYLHVKIESGEHKSYFSVTVFGEQADAVLADYKVGDRVEIEGSLSSSRYQKGDGFVYTCSAVAKTIRKLEK